MTKAISRHFTFRKPYLFIVGWVLYSLKKMIPYRPVILRGESLEEFERYQDRTPSPEEIEYCKEAEEVYLSNPSED
jgi:hypothetical protein